MYCNYLLQDFIEAIEALPEFDKPLYFGLPENIERSSQRMISSQVVTQLRVLKRADAKASKFDKDVWANELGPLLNLWKKLNTVSLLFSPTNIFGDLIFDTLHKNSLSVFFCPSTI